MQKAEANIPIPELHIANLRGIRDMTLTGLRPLTIITGEDGAGKTTVLDALELYANRGDPRVIREILLRDDEIILDAETNVTIPDRDALFRKGNIHEDIRISGGDPRRTIRLSALLEDLLNPTLTVSVGDNEFQVGMENRPDWRFRPMPHGLETGPMPIACVRLGPERPRNELIVSIWDTLALTQGESSALKTVSAATGLNIEQFGCIGDHADRRPMVRLAGESAPRTLRSLGSSAVQAAAIAMATEKAQGGILLIDGADACMSLETQIGLWNSMMAQQSLDAVQVFMTTNSNLTAQAVIQAVHGAGRTQEEAITRVHLERGGRQAAQIG